MKPYYYVQWTPPDAERHDSLAAAQSDAEKRASDDPGHSYEILRCVGIASCSKASTFWMDGEEPLTDDPREFKFYAGSGGVTFWRVSGDEVAVGRVWSGWGQSSSTPEELETSSFIKRITADELPEELA